RVPPGQAVRHFAIEDSLVDGAEIQPFVKPVEEFHGGRPTLAERTARRFRLWTGACRAGGAGVRPVPRPSLRRTVRRGRGTEKSRSPSRSCSCTPGGCSVRRTP